MTIVIDATSLILLAKAGLLEILVERNKVNAPRLVYEEVIKGKDKGREDSMLVERLMMEKQLSIVSVNESVKNRVEKMLNLKGGELEVVSFALGKSHIILTDDRKCLSAAKALKIDFITSLDVIASLYKNGAISKHKAAECIETLEEYGWYKKNLIRIYMEAIK